MTAPIIVYAATHHDHAHYAHGGWQDGPWGIVAGVALALTVVCVVGAIMDHLEL